MPAALSRDLAGELALRLAGAGDDQIDDAVTDALAALAGEYHSDRCYVTMFHADDTFGTSHEWTAPGVLPQRAAIQRLPLSEFHYSSGLLRAGKVFRFQHIDDLGPEAAAERESFGSFGVRSVLEVPIHVDGELLGVVGFNQLHSRARWDDNAVAMLGAVGRAISVALSRRAASERVRIALASAERANRVKDDLIAAASHELRTPLHAILGFAELLALGGVEHEALDQIRTNGLQLVKMIDDLLELGRISSAAGDDADTADVAVLVERVVLNLRPVAAVRGASISIGLPNPQATKKVPVRAHQVLHCVAAAALDAAGADGSVLITLAGSGAPRVEFVYHGAGSRTAGGLALALARTLVEPMRGSIELTEADGAGRITVYCGSDASP